MEEQLNYVESIEQYLLKAKEPLTAKQICQAIWESSKSKDVKKCEQTLTALMDNQKISRYPSKAKNRKERYCHDSPVAWRMILAERKGIRFNDRGLEKLREARESGTGEFPKWFAEDMKNARSEAEQVPLECGHTKKKCQSTDPPRKQSTSSRPEP